MSAPLWHFAGEDLVLVVVEVQLGPKNRKGYQAVLRQAEDQHLVRAAACAFKEEVAVRRCVDLLVHGRTAGAVEGVWGALLQLAPVDT